MLEPAASVQSAQCVCLCRVQEAADAEKAIQLKHTIDWAAASGEPLEPGAELPADRVAPIAPAHITAREVQAALVDTAIEGGAGGVPTTCMAMTMLCMAKGWDASAREALRSAFAALPSCNWLVVTLPFDELTPRVLRAFECARPLPAAAFPQALYLLHREALSNVSVRRATLRDADGAAALLQGTARAEELLAAFVAAAGAKRDGNGAGACVATWQGEVVGLVTLASAADMLPALRRGFDLERALPAAAVQAARIAQVTAFVVNPVFQSHRQEVLALALAACGYECAVCAVPAGAVPVDAASAMQQVCILPGHMYSLPWFRQAVSRIKAHQSKRRPSGGAPVRGKG